MSWSDLVLKMLGNVNLTLRKIAFASQIADGLANRAILSQGIKSMSFAPLTLEESNN